MSPAYAEEYGLTSDFWRERNRRVFVEYGNLAYKEYYAPEETTKTQRRIHSKKQIAKARRRALGYIVAIVVLALSAGFMISTFVTVNETKDQAQELAGQLEDLMAQTSQKSFELEHAIDLSEIEEIATTKLGMQRPDKQQIVYVNVKRDDVLETSAAQTENILRRAADKLSQLWSNIVETFSIE